MTEHEALQKLYIATGLVLLLWDKWEGDLRDCEDVYRQLEDARKVAELVITWTPDEFRSAHKKVAGD